MLMKFLPGGPSHDATASGRGLTESWDPQPETFSEMHINLGSDVGNSALKKLVGLKTARPHQYSAVELTRKPRRLSLLYGGEAWTCLLFIPLCFQGLL